VNAGKPMKKAACVFAEFFGVPRARAGRNELELPSGTVAEILARVEAACPGLQGLRRADGRLAGHYLLSLDGREFVTDLNQVLSPGERLLILSADAGG
jgi:molybdopterin converting factor small subunit